MVILAFLAGPVLAQQDLRELRPRPVGWAIDAARSGNWDHAALLATRAGGAVPDIVEWLRLRSGAGTYEDVMTFLADHADWPGLALLRKANEKQVIEGSRAQILAYFEDGRARTPEGALALAIALKREGQAKAADVIVLDIWHSMSLTAEQQNQFLAAFPDLLKSRIAARVDAMLWARNRSDARQLFSSLDQGQRALAEARIALQTRAKNVDARIKAVPESLRSDPGLQRDRFEWRVRKGRWAEAKSLLLERSASKKLLGNPDAWAGRRRELARDELRDGSAQKAYQMASQHFLTSGSSYADLEWLAGYIALSRLGNAARALEHFENHGNAVKSVISRGRAGYWQGRALQALGDFAGADQAFTAGAANQTSFYGLLAAEAAQLPFDVGLNDVPQEAWRGSVLEADSLFQAGLALALAGERSLAEMFWTQLAEQLGEHDAALLGQAALDIGEPHLAVMIGKTVARRGATIPVPYYALHPLAQAQLPVATEFSLAIARRESEFDPVVVSGVGARGLMQLMPATAREVASQLGLRSAHSDARLTQDPAYNARLGSQYLATLSEQFDGHPVMMSAAYNAGPSRPERWMKLYGDPRGKDLDAMIDWIEGIPFRETRNYVMRVTESLPIYRARLGQNPLPRPFSAELTGTRAGN